MNTRPACLLQLVLSSALLLTASAALIGCRSNNNAPAAITPSPEAAMRIQQAYQPLPPTISLSGDVLLPYGEPWTIDMTLDAPSRMVMQVHRADIRVTITDKDTGRVWTATPMPGEQNVEIYTLRRGLAISDSLVLDALDNPTDEYASVRDLPPGRYVLSAAILAATPVQLQDP